MADTTSAPVAGQVGSELDLDAISRETPNICRLAPSRGEFHIVEQCNKVGGIMAILKEIDKMPESWRDIAILRLIEGRPTREVCEILHITEKACYSRVSRIRKYFEDLFKRDNWP